MKVTFFLKYGNKIERIFTEPKDFQEYLAYVKDNLDCVGYEYVKIR